VIADFEFKAARIAIVMLVTVVTVVVKAKH